MAFFVAAVVGNRAAAADSWSVVADSRIAVADSWSVVADSWIVTADDLVATVVADYQLGCHNRYKTFPPLLSVDRS